ncbi:histone-like nucleoid-structuring protein Lsr2 [Kribbella sp. NPDC049174]|uniref:Lsr2 family DNA-binding protein n=1 Tax=Kribbella sp. NPDC049174 TaxID=3364112 RepID=UPI00371BD168
MTSTQRDLCGQGGNRALRARRHVVRDRPPHQARGRRVSRSTVDADARTVKEWARANGYEVNHRGRVPAHIREAFDAAN